MHASVIQTWEGKKIRLYTVDGYYFEGILVSIVGDARDTAKLESKSAFRKWATVEFVDLNLVIGARLLQ